MLMTVSGAAQLFGAGAVLVGLGMVSIPAAVLVGGAGLILWGVGLDDSRDDDGQGRQ